MPFLTPGQQRNLRNFGFSAMKAGAQPGATTLGALGEAGLSMEELAQKEALQKIQQELFQQKILQSQLSNYDALQGVNARREYQGQTPFTPQGLPEELTKPSGGFAGMQESPTAGADYKVKSIAYGNYDPETPQQARMAMGLPGVSETRAKALQDWLDKNEMSAYQRESLDLRKKEGNSGLTAAQKMRALKISEAQRLYGVNERIATGIVDGIIKTVTDPVQGDTVLLNQATGQAFPLNYAQSSEEYTGVSPEKGPAAAAVLAGREPNMSIAPEEGLYGQIGDSAGALNAVAAAVSGPVGQVWELIGGDPAEVTPTDTLTAKSNFDTAKSDLIRAYSLNSRYPVTEQQRILKDIKFSPTAWDSTATAQTNMRAVDNAMRAHLAEEEKAGRDRTLPAEAQKEARIRAKAIKRFLKTLSVPQAKPAAGIPPAPEGIPNNEWPAIWGAMDPKDRELWN